MDTRSGLPELSKAVEAYDAQTVRHPTIPFPGTPMWEAVQAYREVRQPLQNITDESRSAVADQTFPQPLRELEIALERVAIALRETVQHNWKITDFTA